MISVALALESARVTDLKVIRFHASLLGTARKHSGADLLAIVKGEDIVWPPRTTVSGVTQTVA